MEHRRKHESETTRPERFLHHLRGKAERYPERREQIGRPALAGYGSVAVFRDRHSSCGDDEGCCGRYVERVGAVSTSAAEIDSARRRFNPRTGLSHCDDESAELVLRLALHAHGCEGRAHLALCRRPGDHLPHHFSRCLG